jgi:hypothetical protein
LPYSRVKIHAQILDTLSRVLNRSHLNAMSLSARPHTLSKSSLAHCFFFFEAVGRGLFSRTVRLIERFEQMRRRVLADFAADCDTHLSAVAKVHSAPHTRVAFLGVNLVHAGVVTHHAVEPPEF